MSGGLQWIVKLCYEEDAEKEGEGKKQIRNSETEGWKIEKREWRGDRGESDVDAEEGGEKG